MAGIANDYLIYPILDLIRDEVHRTTTVTADPFEEEPSVRLIREHPLDPEKVTGAKLFYESGYMLDISLTFGSTDTTTFPLEVDQLHPDWEYYSLWRLTSVTAVGYAPDGKTVGSYLIRLLYDTRGLLTGTDVLRIEKER
ncbi:hypothetical protein FB479_106184 [Brevibacillus sp. AG162]|uniref:hypothetical protein n=1 Tax=Brevibacillus sp. AG162 TaxID=2572910 RepID=UPI001150D7A7|nr:hypothetical protein [Brevibacillus sp. AG162]TQK62101.1 hypothetical protein FB479_106184 [Brevibacillus sp. AG162]